MKLVADDIPKFNNRVKSLIRSLNEREEITQDLLINIKKGYLVCKDCNFYKYTNKLIIRYKDNKDSDLTLDLLMVYSANKHKVLKQIR